MQFHCFNTAYFTHRIYAILSHLSVPLFVKWPHGEGWGTNTAKHFHFTPNAVNPAINGSLNNESGEDTEKTTKQWIQWSTTNALQQQHSFVAWWFPSFSLFVFLFTLDCKNGIQLLYWVNILGIHSQTKKQTGSTLGTRRSKIYHFNFTIPILPQFYLISWFDWKKGSTLGTRCSMIYHFNFTIPISPQFYLISWFDWKTGSTLGTRRSKIYHFNFTIPISPQFYLISWFDWKTGSTLGTRRSMIYHFNFNIPISPQFYLISWFDWKTGSTLGTRS